MPAGLICAFEACLRPVTGPDAGRRIEVRQAGEGERAFGPGAPGGKLEDAEGPLVRVYHGKCYFAALKRRRLAATRGPILPGSLPPTG